MSTNPYADQEVNSPYAFQSNTAIAMDDGYVKQVPILGILNIVQASLELLMFFMLVAMTIFMISMQNSPQMQKVPNAPSMQWIGVFYGFLAAAIGAIAAMRLASGILMLKKRGRVFSIVVSIVGLLSVFTCYCAPTSLALSIYSLVVLIQPSVMEDFRRQEPPTLPS